MGTSAFERSKTVAVISLSVLLALCVWQMQIDHADAIRVARDQESAIAATRQFALALTTYDFAHPGVQLLRLAETAGQDVLRRVATASGDLVSARASSLGDVKWLGVIEWRSRAAEVLVKTDQLVRIGLADAASYMTGVLDVSLVYGPSKWTVTNFEWLMAPTAEP